MPQSFWSRLVKRRRDDAVRDETERAGMSRAEREFTKESIEDHQADEFVAEHLGVPPGDRRSEDEPPPD